MEKNPETPTPPDTTTNLTKKHRWRPTVVIGVRVDVEDAQLYHEKSLIEKRVIQDYMRACFREALRGEVEGEEEGRKEGLVEKIRKLVISLQPPPDDVMAIRREAEKCRSELAKETATRYKCEQEKQELQKQLEQLSQKKQEEEAKDIQIKKIESELARAKEAILELMSLLDLATACVEDVEIKSTFMNRLNKIVNQYGTPKPTPIIDKLKSKCKTK